MDFQNDVFGIKILPEGQKGGIYIAGQRLEYNGDYDGLEGAVIYIKEKPPVNILDLSRDRTSINESQLKDIAQWLSNENTTREEKLQVMKVLEPYFRYVGNVEKRTTMDIFLDRFVYYSDTGKNNIKERVNFPEKYVAYSACSGDIIKDLISAGYVICKENFSYAGMRTIKDLIGFFA
jgi:hypothetical protein